MQTIVNRRARFDYELGDEIVAGLSLTGLEVRAAREGHVQLKGAYVTIRGGELWLNNASFSLRQNERGQPNARTVDTSSRKLLASRRQIDQLDQLSPSVGRAPRPAHDPIPGCDGGSGDPDRVGGDGRYACWYATYDLPAPGT